MSPGLGDVAGIATGWLQGAQRQEHQTAISDRFCVSPLPPFLSWIIEKGSAEFKVRNVSKTNGEADNRNMSCINAARVIFTLLLGRVLDLKQRAKKTFQHVWIAHRLNDNWAGGLCFSFTEPDVGSLTCQVLGFHRCRLWIVLLACQRRGVCEHLCFHSSLNRSLFPCFFWHWRSHLIKVI